MRSRLLRAFLSLLVVAVAGLTVLGCGAGTTAQDDQLSPSQRKWLDYMADKGVPNLRKAQFQIASAAGHDTTGAITGSVHEWNGACRHLDKTIRIMDGVSAKIETLGRFSGTAGKTFDAVSKVSDDFYDVYNELAERMNLWVSIQSDGPYAADFVEVSQKYSHRVQKKNLKKAMRVILKQIDAIAAQSQ